MAIASPLIVDEHGQGWMLKIDKTNKSGYNTFITSILD